MITTIDYALMAGGAYLSTRPDINEFPVPEGWIATKKETETSGFEAISFVRSGTTLSTSTDIVISFAGTAGDGDWVHGNFPQAIGMLGDQLEQAAAYYLQVRAAKPSATITFTGTRWAAGWLR